MSAIRRVALPAALVIVTLTTACDGDGGSTGSFCAGLQERGTELMNPAISTQADAVAYLDLLDELGEDVPLAIEEDWDVYAGAQRLTAEIVPGDQVSVEEARRAVYASEESAFRVFDWVAANCGLDLSTLGPVARYDPLATTTTTLAPPATASG